jgi:hypothetical protein
MTLSGCSPIVRFMCLTLLISGCRHADKVIPKGAMELRYLNCAISEKPTVREIAPSRTGTYKWFAGQWYVKEPAHTFYTDQKGGLGISLGGDLVSASQDFSPSLLPTLSGKNGFYVEFEVTLSDNDPDHFPALWLMPAEHNRVKDDVYAGDPSDFERWVEFDVDEGGFGPGHAGAVHAWSGVYPNYQRITESSRPNRTLDRRKKTRFGMSFDPTREEATWWINDRKQKTVSVGKLSHVALKQRFYLIVSAQSHGKQVPYTMTLHRVRAYIE